MRAVNGNTYASNRGAKLGVMHDPAAFVLHFHFFLGVTTFEKCIDLRKDIEGDRMRIDFRARRTTFGSSADLLLQLGNRARAAARNCLITRGKNTLHMENARSEEHT